MPFHLKNGSKIAIIGGGPAGSFFAHFAQKYAKKQGINVNVTIFEKKDFTKKGVPGCNMSADVLSESLLEKLSEQEIHLPPECIQEEINGYFLHVPEYKIQLNNPSLPHNTRIATVFRGNGPKFARHDICQSFDCFLLEHAKNMGAKDIHSTVTSIQLAEKTDGLITLMYEEEKKEEQQYKLVVGAFGVNTTTHMEIEKSDIHYIPTKTIQSCIMDIHPTRKTVNALYDKNIHVFSLGTKAIKFASFIPKGDFPTVCLVGKGDIGTTQLNSFLQQPVVQNILPQGWDSAKKRCFCFPKIPINHALHPYADRLVIIGDAGISRTYKNGIDSAFITAQTAAKTAFETGISKRCFAEGYYLPSRKLLGRDNLYGSLILLANDMLSKHKHIVSNHVKYMDRHPHSWEAGKVNEILWNTVTGNDTYKNIFLKSIHPRLLSRLFTITLYSVFREKNCLNNIIESDQ